MTEELYSESLFPVANQIRMAGSIAERAEQLLRLSDVTLLAGQVDIMSACDDVGFEGGKTFLTWRISALCWQRDAHGMMNEDIARELEAWRLTMSRVAAGLSALSIEPVGGVDGD